MLRFTSLPSSTPSKELSPPERLSGYPSSSESDSTPSPPCRHVLAQKEQPKDSRPNTLNVTLCSQTRSCRQDLTNRESENEPIIASNSRSAKVATYAVNLGSDRPSSGSKSKGVVALPPAQDMGRRATWQSAQVSSTPTLVRRQLRERRGAFRPYTKEKNDRTRQKQGKPPLAQEHIGGVKHGQEGPPPSARSKLKTEANTVITPPTSRNSSTSLTSVPFEKNQNVATTEAKLARTALYVELAGIDSPPVPLFLKSCRDVERLFTETANACNLSEEELELVTVHFPWLVTRNTVALKRNIPDTFEKMMEEILEAPYWGPGSRNRCDVEVKVHQRGHNG